MESTKKVEVELEELSTLEGKESKECQKKKDGEKEVYSTVSTPSEHACAVPPSTRSYTVNKDIERKVRVYRFLSLVLFVICVLLLTVIMVLLVKLTGKQSCEPADGSQECNLKKCQDMYQESLIHESQCMCNDRDCDRGWLKFENSCYFLSSNRLSWQGSREECQKKGGDLAIITNERLQMYLIKNGNLHYWIGLNQVGTNQWTWINDTVLTVRYWGDNKFNGDCALLAANEPAKQSWHSSSCSLFLQYICQKTRS